MNDTVKTPIAAPQVDGASDLLIALRGLPKIIKEIHAKWDEGMRAGKLLIALMDPSLKYRNDITAIHAAIAKAEADAAVAPPSQTQVPRYLNRADGKVYEFVADIAGTVTFKREGRDTLRYLGRAEFDKRFELISPPPQSHVVGAWRVFEDTTQGYWGVEIDGDQDADPILYPIKIRRETLARIVDAHNAALASASEVEG